MSILPHQRILELCDLNAPGTNDNTETNGGPIRPCRKGNVRTAGYDLRLGDQYYLPGQKKRWRHGGQLTVSTLSQQNSAVCVPANQVIIVTIAEELNLPNDVVGHLSLKLDMLLKGLIMASQSQIDAGYRGRIFALLYNLSNEEVCIKRGQSLLRLELAELTAATDLPYNRRFRDKTLSQVLENRISSGLFTMQEEVDAAKKELTKTQLIGVLLAAALSILPAFLTYFGPFANRVTKLETDITHQAELRKADEATQKTERESAEKELQGKLEGLQKELEEIRARSALTPRRQ